jgi:hypothetical protein
MEKLYYMKLKTFCIAQEMVTRLKRQPTEWVKIIASYTSNKGLIRELKKLNFQKINDHLQILFIYLWYWGLNSGPMIWATPPALFCDGFFQDRVSQTICPEGLQTTATVLLMFASWIARITGTSHQCLAHWFCFVLFFKSVNQHLWN